MLRRLGRIYEAQNQFLQMQKLPAKNVNILNIDILPTRLHSLKIVIYAFNQKQGALNRKTNVLGLTNIVSKTIFWGKCVGIFYLNKLGIVFSLKMNTKCSRLSVIHLFVILEMDLILMYSKMGTNEPTKYLFPIDIKKSLFIEHLIIQKFTLAENF